MTDIQGCKHDRFIVNWNDYPSSVTHTCKDCGKQLFKAYNLTPAEPINLSFPGALSIPLTMKAVNND